MKMGVETWSAVDLAGPIATGAVVAGFYDLTCPFCYVAQGKNDLLVSLGLEVVELPFQAHPEVPAGGLQIGERHGPMYDAIGEAARDAGLPLRWQPRLPNSRPALAAAEWARRFDHPKSDRYRRSLFAAHFAEGESIDDIGTLLRLGSEAGIDVVALKAAMDDGSAAQAVAASQQLGRALGVTGTPTWASRGSALVGNRAVGDFERFAAASRPAG